MRPPARFKAETKYVETTEKKANTNLPIFATVGNHSAGVAPVANRPDWYHIRFGPDPVATTTPQSAARLTQCKAEGVALALNDYIYVIKAKDRNLTYYKFYSFVQNAAGTSPYPVGIVISDNVNPAFYIADDGASVGPAIEYIRIDTSDAQPVVTFNDGGADVDFTVEAQGVADAFQVRGSDGRITMGALGAGLLESDAAGVISSDYTINLTVTMAAGQDIDPANASGQDLGAAGARWDLYTQEVYFGGATTTNFISMPDALADALHFVSADAREYQRFVTTNGSEAVIFNNGEADTDWRVAALSTAGACGDPTYALAVSGQFGTVSMGIAPAAGYHLYVYDNTVNTAATYYGGRFYHIKTAGDTDQGDHFYGLSAWMEIDHADTVGSVYGAYFDALLTQGTLGTAAAARSLNGSRSVAQMDGGTIYGNIYGHYARVYVDGGTVEDDTGDGHVFGQYTYVYFGGGTVDGNGYGNYIWVDDDIGVGGTVYMLYLDENTGIDYGLYQSGSAPNVVGGHLYPFNVKAQDLGLATNEWDDIFYVTNNVGTSRLVRSIQVCPVCSTEMSRGTGTTVYRGEVADYAICFCLNCGNAGVETLNHLPSESEIRKLSPPKIMLENIRVKSAGRNRSVAIDFRYGEDVLDEGGQVIERAIRNSTRLGEYEFDEFFAMNDNDRLAFLLGLGQREWESREETRLMLEEVEILKVVAKSKVNAWLGKDLLKVMPN